MPDKPKKMVKRFRAKRDTEETLGAIRLALEGAATDAAALEVIKTLVRQAPPTPGTSTASVALLLAAVREVHP